MDQDKKDLRKVLGKFATGVTVVTFCRDGETFGMTVNSFSSVSLNPPMILFCPALDCKFAEGAEIGTDFTISILSQAQKDVCMHFAGRPNLTDSPWAEDAIKPPVVNGCIAYLCCRTEALHKHGDHYIAVGRVTDSAISGEGEPLMFYSGDYPKIQHNI